MDEHPIDETIERELKTALHIQEDEELPQDVVDLYWTVKRTCDKLGYRYSGDLIVMTVVLTGYGIQEPLENFIDWINRRGIVYGTRVIAKWRGRSMPGRYQSHDSSSQVIRVVLDDETAETREIPAAHVRIPTKEELRQLGEH